MTEDAPYVRIVREIQRRVQAHELRAGDKLPSTREMAQQFGVAIATATKAVAKLKHEGTVLARPRVGIVVAETERRAPRKARTTTGEPETALRRARVVEAAVEIADTEGFAAVSMRSVAARLQVPAMSLYRHVAGREELLVLMADAVFADCRLPAVPPDGWRARLEVVMRLQWSLCQGHPWLARVLSVTRPQLIPNGMHWTEWTLAAVSDKGLSAGEMMHVHVTCMNFVRGLALSLEVEAEAEAETGLDSDAWLSKHDEDFARAFAVGPYPQLRRVTAEPDLRMDLGTLFTFGMERLLDGMAVLFGEMK